VEIQRSPLELALDDGTGVIWIDMQNVIKSMPSLDIQLGEYVLVIGVVKSTSHSCIPDKILAHQIMQLSNKCERESMWFLEVLEYWQNVMQPEIIHLD